MFGYVKPEKGELRVKEYEFYRATYCGICHAMRRLTGGLSRIGLTYDSVFLALVRMTYLSDDAFSVEKARCIVHPLRPRAVLHENPALAYTARAFASLSYHKLLDDLRDADTGHRAAKTAMRPILSSARARAGMSALDRVIEEDLRAIHEMEAAGCSGVDLPAARFGHLLGEVFCADTTGEAAIVLRDLGDHLGRFIYAADAAEDYERDRKSGAYNPFVLLYGGAPLSAENKANIRVGLMLERLGVERAIEFLPFGSRRILESLIRNIVGVGLVRRIAFLDPPDADARQTQKDL